MPLPLRKHQSMFTWTAPLDTFPVPHPGELFPQNPVAGLLDLCKIS